MIEMIVVVIILAMLASMIMPRLGNTDRREFKLAVEQVNDMLTMYAQRECLGEKIVGLQQNIPDNSLELVLLDFDNARPEIPATWRRDFYVKPVKFPPFMRPEDIEVYADGESADIATWPLSNDFGQDRPLIEIVMRGPVENARLLLTPYAAAPVNLEALGDAAGPREKIDLDAAGMSREDW